MWTDVDVEHDQEYLYEDEEFGDDVPFDEIPPEPGRSIHATSQSLTVQVNKELVDQSEFCETDETYITVELCDELTNSVGDGQSSNDRQCSRASRTVRERQSSYDRHHDRSHERERRQGGDNRKVIGMGIAIGDRKDREPPLKEIHRTIQREPGRITINTREDETVSKSNRSSKYDHIPSRTNSGLKDRKRQIPPLDNPTIKRRRLDKPRNMTENSRSAKSTFERLGPAKKKSTERPLNLARSSATINSTHSKSPKRKDSHERQRNNRTRSRSYERRLVSSTSEGMNKYSSSKRRNARDRQKVRQPQISKHVDPHPDHIKHSDPPVPEPSSIEKNISGMIGNLISQVLNEPDIKNMITSLKQHEEGSLPSELFNMSGLQDTVQEDTPPTQNILVKQSVISDSNIKSSIKNIFARHDIPWRENLSSKRKKIKPLLKALKQNMSYSTTRQDIAIRQPSDVDMDISDSEYTEQHDSKSNNDRVPTSSATNRMKSRYDTHKDNTPVYNHPTVKNSNKEKNEFEVPLFPKPIKKIVDIYRYCATCKLEFQTRMLKEAHLQTDLHLMVTDLWWKTHAPPPKIITKKDQIWCIICQVRINIGGHGSAIILLSTHSKGSMHKNNQKRWKGIFNKLPLYEWCFWKDLDHKKMKAMDKAMDKTNGQSNTQKVPAYTFVERCIPK